MNYIYTIESNEAILSHHGIIGQKWGIRRYQNEDGSLTDAEKKRYNTSLKKSLKKSANKYVSDAKKARRDLADFDKQHPELTKFNKGSAPYYDYLDMNDRSRQRLANKNKKTYDLLSEREKLESKFNELSSSLASNKNYENFYKNSEKYIEKYGHEKYKDLLKDDANLYYTELWRTGLDDRLKEAGKVYYRDLNEELWLYD